jgi:alcohol dehydrogenase class IV
MDIVTHDGCEPEPSIEGIDAAWDELGKQDYDLIIAVGGGSVMDTAKAFAVLQGGGGSAWEYTVEMGDGRRAVPQRLLPIVAVPTTAGTGSEVTYNSVLTNRGLGKKAPIRDAAVCPRVALIDPELTVSMPPRLTASTGFDAFTHAYERFFGTEQLSPYIHQLSVLGMQMVIDNLETTVGEPQNEQARTAMSWAATQCGMVVVAEGGEAALHVFGLPIGAVAHVPHGQALAIMLAAITRRHVRTKPHRGRELAGLFGLDAQAMDVPELEDRLVATLVDWLQRVGLPTTMAGQSITADKIPQFMAAISRTRLARVFGPDFDDADVREAYQESL